MKRRTLIVAVIGWMAVAFGVGLWAQAAGQQSGQRRAPTFQPGQPVGPVISGENIGFQPVAGEKARPGTIIGKIMVRVDGQWLEVQSPITVVR